MEQLKFNIHAFAAPSTKAEYISLLDEAIRMAHDLHDLLDGWNASMPTATSFVAAESHSLA